MDETYRLLFAPDADRVLGELPRTDLQRCRTVFRVLARLEADSYRFTLRTHAYPTSLISGPHKDDTVLVTYDGDGPGAWRVWWSFGPEYREITVWRIGPHPQDEPGGPSR